MSYPYLELHNHSHFSILDGISSPKDMAKRAKALGYPALALTDHGEISGWYEFSKACKEQDIVPIFSCEFYIAENIDDKEPNPFKKTVLRCKRGHLIVHAKGQQGLDSVMELYNNSWKEFKEQGNKQIIFEHDLMKHTGKVLVQSACTGSYIDSEDKVERFKIAFGDDFYLEIQPHKLDHEYNMELKRFMECVDKQVLHNKKILNYARKYNVNIVVTGDAHYPTKKDKILQDIQILNSQVGRMTGWYFYQDTNYLMSKEEWWEYFQQLKMEDHFSRDDFEKALETMNGVIEKCKGAVLEKTPNLRQFELRSHELYQEGDTIEQLVFRIIKDVGRFNKDLKYVERLKYEMKIIKEKEFFDYFLLQEDIIRWNRKKGYLIGPARGSAAGCLLAYYMDITKIDPIKYDLLFERFLAIDRSELPDIDTDYEMKEETFDYITQKYGSDYVMSIGAYQTIKIKTAIKNAYRILYANKEYDYNLVNNVTKMIPESNARGEGDQLEIFKDLLKDSKKEFDDAKDKGEMWPSHNLFAFMMNKPDLLQAVGKLLGKVTNLRVHPCSVVIAPEPVKNLLPITTVQSGTSSEKWITAFDGAAVEAAGQVKFDILGLKTLNCISACLREIQKYKPEDSIIKMLGVIPGTNILNKNNIWNIIPNNTEILETFANGDTETVFQFNTDALRRMCIDVQVSHFNDLAAIVALVRPGPLKAGFPQLYMDRKLGRLELDEMYEEIEIKGEKRKKKKTKIKYDHPLMREILKDTYGVITYQEQVQKIFVAIGGFTPIESNKIRKAISKGKRSLITESKPQFSEYATTKLSPAWTSEQVDLFYEDMIGFGSYCFNLSHSVSYALLGYVCQYLKVKYPLEWWSGNLEHAGEKGIDGILKVIQKNNLVPLKTVDINTSKREFYFDGTDIVMPLKFIEGVGKNEDSKGIDFIINGQPYTDLKDFVKRMPGRSVRKNAVMNLIIAGAFKKIEPSKTPQELLTYFIKDLKKEKNIDQDIQMIIDDTSAFERKRTQIDQFYKSDWVEKFKEFFDRRITSISEIQDFATNATVFVGGEISKVKYIPVKKGKNTGQNMVFLTLRQMSDTLKITLWPDQVAYYQELLDKTPEGKIIEVQGKISRYQNEVSVAATKIKEIVVGS